MLHFDQARKASLSRPRESRFGTVQIGKRPDCHPEKNRDMLNFRPGNILVVPGGANSGNPGHMLLGIAFYPVGMAYTVRISAKRFEQADIKTQCFLLKSQGTKKHAVLALTNMACSLFQDDAPVTCAGGF
ncbi:MAG: hypothetical protein LIO46_04785 [Clostridiales bacterium]|nr:hypothetical protein [Clostridiales bacterium]